MPTPNKTDGFIPDIECSCFADGSTPPEGEVGEWQGTFFIENSTGYTINWSNAEPEPKEIMIAVEDSGA